MKYKLLVSDIDGVWTNGSFYYTTEGDSIRKFTTRDSYGVRLCQLMEIPVLIISTEDNSMVEKRMEKLNIKYVKLGVRNKLRSIMKFCEQKQIDLSEVAYLGDDMNDFHLIGKLGFFACPFDAYPLIQKGANHILEAKGGEGAFREFVEHILSSAGQLEEAYHKYTLSCLA